MLTYRISGASFRATLRVVLEPGTAVGSGETGMNQAETERPIGGLDLDNYVPFLINALSSGLSASASATYRALYSLSVLEWRILTLLARVSGVSAQEVANVVGQDKGPVSRAIRRLENRALVTVEPAEKGHRHRLSITPAGRQLFDASLPVAERRESVLLEGFSAAERDQLRGFLKRLIEQIPKVAAIHARVETAKAPVPRD